MRALSALRKLRGKLLWMIFVVAALLAAPSPAAAQSRADPDTALLFELRVGAMRVGDGVRAFNTSAGVCLDFKDIVAALNLAIEFDAKADRATGWVFKESRRIEIDRTANRASYGGEYAVLGNSTIWESRSGWCVLATALGQWLGITLEPDVTDAVLNLTSDTELPIFAASARVAAATRLEARQSAPQIAALPLISNPYRLWRTPSLDFNLGLMSEREGTRTRAAPQYEVALEGELAFASVEARFASNRDGAPGTAHTRFYREDAGAALLGPIRATQWSIGDVTGLSTSLVARGASGRGISLSNRPRSRSSNFDTTDFEGPLQAGWDIELYRNGELVAAWRDMGSGRYVFRDVELHYGRNLFEIVRYGPQGQIIRETELRTIGEESLPPGAILWWVNALDDEHGLIPLGNAARPAALRGGLRIGGGFELGLGQGTTVSTSAYTIEKGGSRRHLAEFALRGAVGPMVAEIKYARAADGGGAAEVSLLGNVLATDFRFDAIQNGGLQSERLDRSTDRRARLALRRPIHVSGMIVPISFDLATMQSRTATTVDLGANASIRTRKLAFNLSVGWHSFDPVDGPRTAQADAALLFSTHVGEVRIRGETDWTLQPQPHFTRAQVSADWDIGERAKLALTANYDAAIKAKGGSFRLSRDFGLATLVTELEGDTRGRSAFRIGAVFSLGPNAHGRFGDLRSRPRQGAASLAVSVFQDLNADGVWQPGEPDLPKANVLVNDLPTSREDARAGPLVVAGLEPGAMISLAVDPASLDDPSDIPESNGVRLAPRTGGTVAVRLAVVSTGSIEGTLLEQGHAAAGERIEIVDSKGDVVRAVVSEFDGLFQAERLSLGTYRVRVPRLGGDRSAIAVSLSPARPDVRIGTFEQHRPAGVVAAQ